MEFEQVLVRHGAPTLAGLKTASMFWYSFQDLEQTCEMICQWNDTFLQKGIRLDILKINRDRMLLYVYRETRLWKDLEQPEARRILESCGYRLGGMREILAHLRERLQDYQEFPHEIGLFLGYPVEDVRGFIENGGKNFCCSGCWKAYCRRQEKEKLFSRFRKCEAVYMQLFLKGRSVWQLTVAA